MIRQTKYVVMMTKEGSTKNVKFYISHYSEYVLSSCLSIYFTLLKDYDAAFLYNCWFLFIIIMGLLICNYGPFWQEFSVKSLILRWTLRPVGLFPAGISTLNQRWINVALQRWINVEFWLHMKVEATLKLQRCFNVRYQRWIDVENWLKKRW